MFYSIFNESFFGVATVPLVTKGLQSPYGTDVRVVFACIQKNCEFQGVFRVDGGITCYMIFNLFSNLLTLKLDLSI